MTSTKFDTDTTLFANPAPLVRFCKLLTQQRAVLVQIESTQGSVPRETGTWMAVFAEELVGTIGGGHLEHQSIAHARLQLFLPEAGVAQNASQPAGHKRFALGPSLGQCCGGVVNVAFRAVSAVDLPELMASLQTKQHPVALFGGGHVGHALFRVLAGLPFALTWIDSRDGVFPSPVPCNVHCEHSEPVQAAVSCLVPHSLVLIMSFSHAEDMDVLAACLRRQRDRSDLPYIGLIGSHSKWATFRRRLEAQGFTAAELAHVTSPIGIAGIGGKAPEVIAVSVAAQLLQCLNVHQSGLRG